MALADIALLLARQTACNRQHLAVLARLLAGGASLQELIDAAALSRRGVEAFLRVAGEDVVADADGRQGLRPQAREGYEALLASASRPELRPELLEELRAARARAPKPNRNLDHVAATAETVLRRASWIARRFETNGLRVLFVGDHDLTSLAVAKLCPSADIAVVDIDEALVEFLAAELSSSGAKFRVRHADLRQRFPADLEAWADLFVADPPYTPDGVALFCARGAQGLRCLAQGRGLVAYGYGEAQPALGLAVQKAIVGLDCLVEELIPDFNRYQGAQAIGSASDLHLLRFAPSAAKKVDRIASGGAPAAIYTHGRQSVESSAAAGALDLRKHEPSALFRALLWEQGDQLALLVDNNHPDVRSADAQARLREDFAEKWNLRLRKSAPDSVSAIIEADAVGGAGPRGLVLARPHGKVKNVLREALVRSAGGRTKNQARELVGSILASLGPWGEGVGECVVGDAPRAMLRTVLHAMENAVSHAMENAVLHAMGDAVSHAMEDAARGARQEGT
ncbi:protein of unknown function DUF43 [Segniliparus rotundus DSM 44985]|uniref:N(4)-bis(aminopropyl)spermidine synthase C-terminal domain-containing protein n=1 Tax=Segniliparus rotundus (strain ATCC BAA-972 / CDC 1076 / CIP 108378 / DSM 44985 / JCM 13578) TaxID=640132 RepID=D6ZAB4_SEGRD|nr:bis-aminopropyl spermidine synthase family protein [Segniliparus rotundus]ADG96656.1 protein of unknown function DUF43 [Segniliparus rotundus DSM 44985]